MFITDPRIEDYLFYIDRPMHPHLGQMEEYAKANGFPIVDRLVGKLLYLLAQGEKPGLVLELGSGYGYSAYYFARALAEGGKVVCTDLSAENRRLALSHFENLGVSQKIEFHVGNALEFLENFDESPDIIFMDMDKEQYPAAYPAIKRKLRPGGVLLVDNMLWDGRVVQPDEGLPSTRAVWKFTEMVFNDPEIVATVIPLRDGVLYARKLLFST